MPFRQPVCGMRPARRDTRGGSEMRLLLPADGELRAVVIYMLFKGGKNG